MSAIIYNIFLSLYHAGIRIASLWNKKAGQWVSGRKNIFQKLEAGVKQNDQQLVWIHCSSLGEFEQGRPVLEKIRELYPGTKILLTFFSPSGYEIRKNYEQADWVFYLPADSAGHAKKFLDITRPALAVFIKYDYWFHYLSECRKRNIPLLMVSAIFRDNQPFFRWYGRLHRKMLFFFTHIFVQDERSKLLLEKAGISNVTIAGDTRVDRVSAIAEKSGRIPHLKNIPGDKKIIVAGSTWPEDEKLIRDAIAGMKDLVLIMAPHEIHHQHLDQIKGLFTDAVLLSQFNHGNDSNPFPSCLVIDNIGMLSKLYRYADICFVGGGFNKGIHNILEASVYHKPVIFGPRYDKFREAHELISSQAAFAVHDASGMTILVKELFENKNRIYETAVSGAASYFMENKGATESVMRFIQENRLLTS